MSEYDPLPDHTASKMQICPHLGIEEDAQTCLEYPSPWNFCHRAKPAQAVRSSYQRAKCLGAAYPTCSVFLDQDARRLPRELCAAQKSRVKKSRVR